jgi:Uncharacterized protein conserved in bacteria (DUF2141)
MRRASIFVWTICHDAFCPRASRYGADLAFGRRGGTHDHGPGHPKRKGRYPTLALYVRRGVAGALTRDHDQAQPAKVGGLTFKFQVPPGTYAAAGYHDENGNGKFDTTLIGLPEEGYMFSSNVRPVLSAPSFASASFTVPQEGTAISIVVQYP